jgi:hypothetical protein
MNFKPYLLVSGTVFFVVGLLHLARLGLDWAIQIGPWTVPDWVSIVGCPVAWVLAVWAFGLARK